MWKRRIHRNPCGPIAQIQDWGIVGTGKQISTQGKEEHPSNLNSPKVELTNLCDNVFSVSWGNYSKAEWWFAKNGAVQRITELAWERGSFVLDKSWSSLFPSKLKWLLLNFFTLPHLFFTFTLGFCSPSKLLFPCRVTKDLLGNKAQLTFLGSTLFAPISFSMYISISVFFSFCCLPSPMAHSLP